MHGVRIACICRAARSSPWLLSRSTHESVPVAIGTALHRRTWQLVDRFLPVSQVLADFLIDRGFAPQAITVKPNFMPDPGAPTAPGR